MNELDLVRDMRADVSFPAPEHLAAGHNRLLISISRPPRPSRRWRIAIPAGLATAAAAAVVAITVAGSATTPSAPIAHPAPAPRLNLAADVLRDAAVTVSHQTAVKPGPHQWFDTTFIMGGYGQPTGGGETWYRFDGNQYAEMDNGHVSISTNKHVPAESGTALDRWDDNITPENAYNALESLPSDPAALLAAVDHQLATTAKGGVPMPAAIGSPPNRPQTQGEQEFAYLYSLLWNSVEAVPPTAQANVFNAMAAISGISTQSGITDAAGRPAIGVSANGGFTQLLLDPHTYRILGERLLSTGIQPPAPTTVTVPPKGTIIESSAWVTVKAVSGPGRH